MDHRRHNRSASVRRQERASRPRGHTLPDTADAAALELALTRVRSSEASIERERVRDDDRSRALLWNGSSLLRRSPTSRNLIVSLRDEYAVDHIVYHWVSSDGEQYGCGTYPLEWVQRYVDRDYLRVDPVVIGCYQRFHPVDWKRLDWSSRAARAFMKDAIDYGIGNQGYSIPIRGPQGQFALVHRQPQLRRRELGGLYRGAPPRPDPDRPHLQPEGAGAGRRPPPGADAGPVAARTRHADLPGDGLWSRPGRRHAVDLGTYACAPISKARGSSSAR